MTSSNNRSTLDVGLLALRVGVGGTLFAHGAQKLFGWFGGDGLDATAGAFGGMGFKPAKPSAALAGLSEAGGALIALGAATPVAAAGAVGAMIGASAVHKPAGFFAMSGGYEYPATLGLASAALALTGPGRYSVDAALGHRFNTSRLAIGALAAAGAGAGFVVARRQKAVAAAANTPEAA
jgi:putative oxidoreductase